MYVVSIDEKPIFMTTVHGWSREFKEYLESVLGDTHCITAKTGKWVIIPERLPSPQVEEIANGLISVTFKGVKG